MPDRSEGVHPDTAPACNGVATSSSPFQSHSEGDEDIAAPNPFQKGAVSECSPSEGRVPSPDAPDW